MDADRLQSAWEEARQRRLSASVAILTLIFALAPAAFAQATGKVYEIGVVFNAIPMDLLSGTAPKSSAAMIFMKGLRERGWVDGKNVRILWRSAEGRPERIPAILDELVRRPVDLLVVADQGREALRKTRTIPVVATFIGDPSEEGLVASLSRPGGNLTGITDREDQFVGKGLSILKQIAPEISRVAYFVNPGGSIPGNAIAAGAALGIKLFAIPISAQGQLPKAIADAAREGANGILIPSIRYYYSARHLQEVHAAARRHRLPVVMTRSYFVGSGGLMSYGLVDTDFYRRLPHFVDRILRGTKPGELPIEQLGDPRLHINLEAANAIGLKVPQAVLMQADRVVPAEGAAGKIK